MGKILNTYPTTRTASDSDKVLITKDSVTNASPEGVSRMTFANLKREILEARTKSELLTILGALTSSQISRLGISSTGGGDGGGGLTGGDVQALIDASTDALVATQDTRDDGQDAKIIALEARPTGGGTSPTQALRFLQSENNKFITTETGDFLELA